MGPQRAFRAYQAAERRFEREAQKRRRELARLEKERAKLSAVEQARLEVETYENQLEVLLSVHKEPSHAWDWLSIFTALRPPDLKNHFMQETRAKQRALVTHPDARAAAASEIASARALDEQCFNDSAASLASEIADMEKLRVLARRILDGEHMAFIEAFAELNPVAEFSSAGSLRRFAVESKDLIECVFKANAAEAIPTQVKTLTTTGKVSIKPMPKAQYHELCQDYVCSCVLRMAREVFAMLPVSALLVTAIADVPDQQTGHCVELPVLSVVMHRANAADLDFENQIPADLIERFQHRGNFKVSRKAGAFQPITPFIPGDVQKAASGTEDVAELCAKARQLRETFRTVDPLTRVSAFQFDA